MPKSGDVVRLMKIPLAIKDSLYCGREIVVSKVCVIERIDSISYKKATVSLQFQKKKQEYD